MNSVIIDNEDGACNWSIPYQGLFTINNIIRAVRLVQSSFVQSMTKPADDIFLGCNKRPSLWSCCCFELTQTVLIVKCYDSNL